MPRFGTILVVMLVMLVVISQWRIAEERSNTSLVASHTPAGVMGTQCRLLVVIGPHQLGRADAALRGAEAALRQIEAKMSVWLDHSELSQLNAAPADQEVELSEPTRRVLAEASSAYQLTGGAFDVTCLPQIELWRDAGRQQQLPTPEQRAASQAASNWQALELTEAGAVKRSAQLRVDLGGIAKGFAIDAAIQAMQAAGVRGGLVEVGGDMAGFGQPPNGRYWHVDVQHPDMPSEITSFELDVGAVATSGDYARYVEIGGQRFSHIIDPRHSRPADGARSVTVLAPTALQADIWATALSVLGPPGLELLEEGVEALIVSPEDHPDRWVSTPGFPPLREKNASQRLETP